MSQPEAFSGILIDKALECSGWNLLNPQQIQFEPYTGTGRALKLQKELVARVSDIRAMQAISRRCLDDLFHSLLHRTFQGEL